MREEKELSRSQLQVLHALHEHQQQFPYPPTPLELAISIGEIAVRKVEQVLTELTRLRVISPEMQIDLRKVPPTWKPKKSQAAPVKEEKAPRKLKTVVLSRGQFATYQIICDYYAQHGIGPSLPELIRVADRDRNYLRGISEKLVALGVISPGRVPIEGLDIIRAHCGCRATDQDAALHKGNEAKLREEDKPDCAFYAGCLNIAARRNNKVSVGCASCSRYQAVVLRVA